MTENDPNTLWTDFLITWPVDRVQQMTLDEYTNPNRDDAFIYWLEKRLESLGSIWGGSAFKFGIYRRDRTDPKEPSGGRVWGDEYAWMLKYGKTAKEAFATVRSRLLEIIEATRSGNLEAIDEIDFSPVIKWKVAFLYQDRENPRIFNIYKKDTLVFHYQRVDPSARAKDVPHSVLYTTLLDRFKEKGDVFAIADELWSRWEKKPKATYWAAPVGWALNEPGAIESLLARGEVTSEDLDPALDKFLSNSDIAVGDHVAFLVGDTARALGEITNAEPGDFAWRHVPVVIPVSLVPPVTSEIRRLTDAEEQALWRRSGGKSEPQPATAWKIAPGPNAHYWDEWKAEGHVSIGWPDLGDLSGVDRRTFDERAKSAAKRDPEEYKLQGMEQLWKFIKIPVGSRVVANRGKSHVIGLGTVTGDYFFEPGPEYPHRLPVGWDWTGDLRLSAPRNTWQVTIWPVEPADFAEIEAKTLTSPASGLPRPKNIILYGPPGTGKTYSTVSRALELVLGESKVADMSFDTKSRQFRRLQQEGRIEFVTFHQAYGYEEFVEGIRPVLGTADAHEIRYELHDGVFKRIARRATAEGLRDQRGDEPTFESLWGRLVSNVETDENRVVESYMGRTYVLRTTTRGNLEIAPCEVDSDGAVLKIGEAFLIASKANVQLVWEHRHELGLEPEAITLPKTTKLFAQERGGAGGHHYTAIWIVYKEMLELARAGLGRPSSEDRLLRVQEVLDKPTSGAVDFRFAEDSPQYVLIIDEINRGNVSKILGELITLLEPDKRLGTTGELKLPLSYSPGHRFAVPPNIHVLGTMNTADRSIALMDVALRRRFTFEEMMPDAAVIRDVLGPRVGDAAFTELVIDLMETMNRRIRFLYDRDHQLGHSYFLEATSYDELRALFADRLVPLLQEYFYGAWDRICTVLGCPVDESGKPFREGPAVVAGSYVAPVVRAEIFGEAATLGFDHEEYEDRLDFRIDPEFTSTPDASRLLTYFLGILDLDSGEMSRRRRELQGGALLTDEAVESP